MRKLISFFLFVAPLILCPVVYAASCSAKNDIGDTCNIDCPIGSSASCANATGAGSPTCSCNYDLNSEFKIESSTPSTEKPLLNGIKIIQTSPSELLNNLLASKGNKVLDVVCRQVPDGPAHCRPSRKIPCFAGQIEKNDGVHTMCFEPGECFQKTKTECSNVIGKLSISGDPIMDNRSEVKVEQPTWNGIPDTVRAVKLKYLNCSSEVQKQEYEYNKTVSSGSRVQMTKAITDKMGIEVNVGFNFVVSGSQKITYNHDISVSDVKEQSNMTSTTFREKHMFDLPKMSVSDITIRTLQATIPVQFSGNIVFDALVIKNAESLKLVSQLIPDPLERALEYAGFIYNATQINDEISVISRPVVFEDCKGYENKTLLTGESLLTPSP